MRNSIQVLDRALDALEWLGRAPGAAHPLGDIAAGVRLHAATAARILASLAARGYVEQDGPRKGWRLGPMAYTLASRGPYRHDLVRAATPRVERLARDVRESTVLAVLRAGRRYTLCRADGGENVQVRSEVMHELNPYRRATGRLLLAHLEPRELDRFVEIHGLPGSDWPEVRSRKSLDEALGKLRQLGVLPIVSDGVAAAAAPVRERGRVTAALGVYLPEHRFRGAHRRDVLARLEEAADELSARLNGTDVKERTGGEQR